MPDGETDGVSNLRRTVSCGYQYPFSTHSQAVGTCREVSSCIRTTASELAAKEPGFLYAYFQNCNHLADCVIGDVPSWTPTVQQLIVETVELRVSRDTCNATKRRSCCR